MILGFLKPDQGSIRVNGFDVSKKLNEVRKIIGYVPDHVSLYPHLTGIENLDYFCRLAGLKYTVEELEHFLEMCTLQSIAFHQRLSIYSKGMIQKVGIAIAYAKKAQVYLLDEPSSGLDPIADEELSVLLKKLASQHNAIANPF